MLDSNMFRTNTPENFIHNFRVACKMYANNHAEAMEMGSQLIETFTKNDRKVLKKTKEFWKHLMMNYCKNMNMQLKTEKWEIFHLTQI